MQEKGDIVDIVLIWRLDLTESKVRELILELQPDFVLFQQLPALVPDVQQYDLIPANTISHSGTIEKEKVRGVRNEWHCRSLFAPVLAYRFY